MRNANEYFEIPLEFDAVKLFEQGGQLEEYFYVRDLQQRKLFLNDVINSDSVSEIIHHILQFNREDAGIPVEEREPILLYLTSVGGSVDDGFGLIDVIQSSITPVYTVNVGYWQSMGFLIGLAGHKRYAFKNSTFLMHQIRGEVLGTVSNILDGAKFNSQVDERIKKYVLSRSTLTSRTYDSKYHKEWYGYADEAKKYGFIDYIIGEDCSLEDVI